VLLFKKPLDSLHLKADFTVKGQFGDTNYFRARSVLLQSTNLLLLGSKGWYKRGAGAVRDVALERKLTRLADGRPVRLKERGCAHLVTSGAAARQGPWAASPAPVAVPVDQR
jgi:hypothetical protein